MTDPANPHIDEEDLREAMELLFFAYRDFTKEPDAILAQYGFGRAHHRVIYFVGRNPGTTVSDLLGILKITKQSLSRVLGQLVSEDFVVRRTDSKDKRRRLLYLAPKGEKLERQLTGIQSRRIAHAYARAGSSGETGFKAVLKGMIGSSPATR